jgi:hypothetical protein
MTKNIPRVFETLLLLIDWFHYCSVLLFLDEEQKGVSCTSRRNTRITHKRRLVVPARRKEERRKLSLALVEKG